jgi:hypothetical protein
MRQKVERVEFADPLREKRLDELLDEALKETFPASDPIAVDVDPSRERGKRSGPTTPSNKAGKAKATTAGPGSGTDRADRIN